MQPPEGWAVCTIYMGWPITLAQPIQDITQHIASTLTRANGMNIMTQELPPFHLAVWCQVKHTCCSMNLPVIVHTCNEKCQDHSLYSQVVMHWTFSEQNGEKTPF